MNPQNRCCGNASKNQSNRFLCECMLAQKMEGHRDEESVAFTVLKTGQQQ